MRELFTREGANLAPGEEGNFSGSVALGSSPSRVDGKETELADVVELHRGDHLFSSRVTEAASVMYLAYSRARGAYAPSWESAAHKLAWRAAAAAVLDGIDNGTI